MTEDRGVTVAALRARNEALVVEVGFLKEQLAKANARVVAREQAGRQTAPRPLVREGGKREGHGRFCACLACRPRA